MPKEDYLLKYLEKLSRVIAAMLGFREKGLPENALHLADETFKEWLKLDLVALQQLTSDDFIQLIRNESYNTSYINSMAEICLEIVKSYSAKGDAIRIRLFAEKALLLYLFLNEKDKTFSFEREMIISELLELTK
jgi:hypothetical protein